MLTTNRPAWVFISYRHDAGGRWVARNIADGLATHLGPNAVFCDTSSVQASQDWDETIRGALLQSEVCIVLIHLGWHHERLHDPDDWVCREISLALQRGLIIVPVLVDGSKMPSPAELPNEIKSLAAIQAAFVEGRSDASLIATIGVLAQIIMRGSPSQVVVKRERPGWVGQSGKCTWILRLDDEPVLRIEGLETTATCTTPSGIHTLSLSWFEMEPFKVQVKGTGPSYSSFGETEKQTFVLRPGVHTFTLRAYPEKRPAWKKITDIFSNYDSSPRAIMEESFVLRMNG